MITKGDSSSPTSLHRRTEKHRTLMVEFGCDRSDPGDVITLGIRGLQKRSTQRAFKSGGSRSEREEGG